MTAAIPDDYYTENIGKAKVVRAGSAVSIITYGYGVRWAQEAVDSLGVDAEILDLRTLLPLDFDAIAETVRKTNKAIVLHEDTLFGGIGGEISAYISEHLFEYLDGPVMRVASLDTPVPFAAALEQQFLPAERFREQLQKLLDY